MQTCNDCIHSEVCVRQKIYGEYSITECKGHFLGKADVVEVVRCKDCKFYDMRNGKCLLHSEEADQYSRGYDFEMYANDFCSYGEKRSEDK